MESNLIHTLSISIHCPIQSQVKWTIKKNSLKISLKSALFKSYSIKYGLLIPGNILRTNSGRITVVAYRILVNALGVKYACTFATVWRFIMLSDRKLMARPAIVIPWRLKHAENTKDQFFCTKYQFTKIFYSKSNL